MWWSFGHSAALVAASDFSVVTHDLTTLRPLIRAAVARRLGRPVGHADVDDAEAEVLRRALEGRHRLDAGAALRPWVLGIARHVALDQLRRRGRERPIDPADAPDVVDPAPGPARLLDARRQAARVEDALASLPEGQRQALVLFHGKGLGYQAIADRLGVPVGTVCTWISRARRRVAQAVDAPPTQRNTP